MAIYMKQELIAQFPAYDIFQRDTSGVLVGFDADGNGVFVQAVNIVADDTLGLECSYEGGVYYREYKPGSVVSYSLRYNEDPIAAVADAKKRGQPLYWINACASYISNSPRAKKNLVKVEVGMLVRFEGKLFTIVAQNNQNIGLAPFKVEPADVIAA